MGRGKAMMRSVFGALGLVALFVAIVVGTYGAFVIKPPAGPDIAAGLEATSEATNPQAGQAAAIGEAVTAEDISWTVTDARQETELHTYTFPPKSAPGSYVSMDFTVENVSEGPATLTGETITLVDASGIEYQPEPDRNTTFIRPELNILFSEYSLIEPGASKEGKVNFEVLPNSSGFRVLLGGTDPTVSEGRYVDLGF